MKVTTEEEAQQVLIREQERQGGIATIPARSETKRTEAGWAFFNFDDGYLGTVTEAGEVIQEPGMDT